MLNMLNQRFKFKFVDESPWPFLVSTASLFLTLGAVMFFCFFDQGYNDDIAMCMMSWSGLGSRISDITRNTILTGVGAGLGGYSGNLVNSRYYSLNANKEHLYGDVYIDPSNYNEFTLILLRKLAKAFENQNVDEIYKYWNLVITNPDGHLSLNYGKIHNTVNMATNYYNGRVERSKIVTEKGFFESRNIVVGKDVLNDTDNDQFNSLTESITMEVTNNKNLGIQYVRNSSNGSELPNLGLQNNNDCIFKLRIVGKNGVFELGYVDCKKTDDLSFHLKLEKLQQQGILIEDFEGTKGEFGCNLYLIASKEKDIILNEKEKKTVLEFIDKMAVKYPKMFKNYQDSSQYIEFKNTGKLNALSSSIYPFPKTITNFECQKFLRSRDFTKDKNFKQILIEMEQQRTGRLGEINFTQNENDDI